MNNHIIPSLSTIEILTYLDPEINKLGVYVIQSKVNNTNMDVSILDPFGTKISKSTHHSHAIEEKFPINNRGTYTLIINNKASMEVQTIDAIGYSPSEYLVNVETTCLYMIVIGLAGVIICSFSIIISRRSI